MNLLDIVKSLKDKNLVDEDGEPIEVEFLPAMTTEEIDDFSETLPCKIPEDIRELLGFCRGFDGLVDMIDFTGGLSYKYEDVFPYGLPIAADGFGNFWVVDLQPESTCWGPIYFACHDAPVILYQSHSLTHFIEELIKIGIPPHKSEVDDVLEDRNANVWSKNPNVMSFEECLNSEDEQLTEFAKQLDQSFQFIDLRQPRIGYGFSWGRYGPNTVNKRFGSLPIFAYQKKKGIFQRIFGK